MTDWKSLLHYDPIKPLLDSNDEAIEYFVKRDLLGNEEIRPNALWVLPKANQIIKKQLPNGSWKYPGGNARVRSAENYNQIETFRQLGYLIEMYGLDKSSAVIDKACDYLLGFQTEQGDIRGILGTQYTPYYTAAIIELCVKAGYSRDERIDRAFTWLKDIRQGDGGWAIPLRTRGKKLDILSMNTPTLEPDRSKPYSHLVTGVVLRAYAAHEKYRNAPEAQQAGKLLLDRFFKKDAYTDRGSPDFWLRFTYPFWFTDLISALDSLARLGFNRDNLQVKNAVAWLVEHQEPSGLWKLKTLKNEKEFRTDLWISLSICRVVALLYGDTQST